MVTVEKHNDGSDQMYFRIMGAGTPYNIADIQLFKYQPPSSQIIFAFAGGENDGYRETVEALLAEHGIATTHPDNGAMLIIPDRTQLGRALEVLGFDSNSIAEIAESAASYLSTSPYLSTSSSEIVIEKSPTEEGNLLFFVSGAPSGLQDISAHSSSREIVLNFRGTLPGAVNACEAAETLLNSHGIATKREANRAMLAVSNPAQLGEALALLGIEQEAIQTITGDVSTVLSPSALNDANAASVTQRKTGII